MATVGSVAATYLAARNDVQQNAVDYLRPQRQAAYGALVNRVTSQRDFFSEFALDASVVYANEDAPTPPSAATKADFKKQQAQLFALLRQVQADVTTIELVGSKEARRRARVVGNAVGKLNRMSIQPGEAEIEADGRITFVVAEDYEDRILALANEEIPESVISFVDTVRKDLAADDF